MSVDLAVDHVQLAFSFGDNCGLSLGTVEQTNLAKRIAHLIVPEHPHISAVAPGVLFRDGALEQSRLHEVHTISEISFADDDFFGFGLDDYHAVDEELLVLLLEVLEEETVHEVEPCHDLGLFVLVPHRPQTDGLALGCKHLISFRTDSLPHLPDHVLPFQGLPEVELLLADLLEPVGVLLRVRVVVAGFAAVLKVPKDEFLDVFRSVYHDFGD